MLARFVSMQWLGEIAQTRLCVRWRVASIKQQFQPLARRDRFLTGATSP